MHKPVCVVEKGEQAKEAVLKSGTAEKAEQVSDPWASRRLGTGSEMVLLQTAGQAQAKGSQAAQQAREKGSDAAQQAQAKGTEAAQKAREGAAHGAEKVQEGAEKAKNQL